MQFFLGVATTIVALFMISKFIKPESPKNTIKVRRSQSHTFETIKVALPLVEILTKAAKKTQSTNFQKQGMVRVIVIGNSAYWIKDNSVYTAEVNGEEIKKETTKVVDMMGMDDVELDRMIFIIDKLTEGIEDDRGNSSYPKF